MHFNGLRGIIVYQAGKAHMPRKPKPIVPPITVESLSTGLPITEAIVDDFTGEVIAQPAPRATNRRDTQAMHREHSAQARKAVLGLLGTKPMRGPKPLTLGANHQIIIHKPWRRV